MEIHEIKIEDIKPYEKNPRKNNEAVKYVSASIKQFGFKVPLVIDKDNVIVAGHTRYKAAKKLGINKIPCLIANDLTEEQVKAFRLADNKVAEASEWDFDLLALEMEDIVNIDMKSFGFDFDLSDDKNDEIIEDDFNEEPPEEPNTKYGDIYKLGRHLLMCGDCTKENDVRTVIKDMKADLGFLDPPYDMEDDSWIENLGFIKKGAPILLMASDKQTLRIGCKIPNFRQFIVHDREQAVLSCPVTPMSQHTIISLFCDHPKKYFVNCNDHFTSIIKCRKDYKKAKNDMNSKMGKPVKVIADLIKHYSKNEDVILDYFAGGGSTMIACEQLGRKCIMLELDAGQCDLIVKRYEEFTGEKAKILK